MMKPIEGIDLAKLIEREADDYIRERTEEVLKQVRAIASQRRSWAFLMEAKAKEIEELRRKIESADMKLETMSRGDWSPLRDDKPKEPGQ
jgi:hypothetical protein